MCPAPRSVLMSAFWPEASAVAECKVSKVGFEVSQVASEYAKAEPKKTLLVTFEQRSQISKNS